MRFKNFTLLLGAFFMLAASSQAANVALEKKVYASSNQQPPELAVDDNLGTRWESKASDGDNQWFYVDLEKGTFIDHLKIVWEGAYGKHYKIHVADEITTEMALKLTDDDKTNDFATGWTEIAEINKTLSGFPASETIAVSTTDVVTARYVAVELIERGSPYGFSFWEFGVYDMAEEASKLSSIEIMADKLEGSVADTYTLGYKFLDQYKMNYILTAEENASRQMIVSEGATLDGDKITVSSRGTYTVKMKIGDIESNELKIDVKAEGANLALKKDIVFATEGSKNPENAVDGNLGSLWITDEPSGVENHEYDAVLVVDLGETYDVNCVHTSFEGASSADYTITFSTDNVTFSDPVPAFTVTNGIGMTNRHDWLTSEEAIKARYVKFHSTRAATQYGTKLYELEVYTNSAPVLSNIILSADNTLGVVGDKFSVTAQYTDQFGGEYNLSEAEKSAIVWNGAEIAEDGTFTPSEGGMFKLSQTINGITSNNVEIRVMDISQYENLAIGKSIVDESVVSSDSEVEILSSATNAIDGNLGSEWSVKRREGVIAQDVMVAEFTVDLGDTYKISGIRALWEGASSDEYTVAYSNDNKTFTDALIVAEKSSESKVNARKDLFVADSDIFGRYIRLKSTHNSSIYGLRLFELEVYGDGTTSSVASIAAESTIFVAGNEVVLPEGTVEATVFNLNGAVVAHAEGTATMSIATVQPGVYVVKAVKADGTVVAAKIVK